MKTSAFACPECKTTKTKCVDSRLGPNGWRRRRLCENGHRFTTLECAVPEGQSTRECRTEAQLIRDAERSLLEAEVLRSIRDELTERIAKLEG